MKIIVKDYTKIINDNVILDNVNLTFESGNIYGFYGKNGSGKSMFFRALTTLIYPTSGDILIDDVSLIKDSYDLRNFGVVIEDPGFYPSLSGFKNLELLYTINHKKNDKVINDVLDKVGLLKYKNKTYKEYSFGMKQKLRIAQSIMEDQKIIIWDEPTNGLDSKSIKDIYNLILEEKKKDKVIFIASHNKEDLDLLCDKIYHVYDGKFELINE